MADNRTNTYGAELLGRLTTSVVGRRRELEAAVASLAARRHLLLEGPPGTGKSTLLRSIAQGAGSPFVFVEGNAELTPSRLTGSFDPAVVLNEGYSADAFVPGPLVRALEDGALLYLEEINRIPEETLNVLITVMSEGELHIPRLGRIVATDGFRFVAAMNPFDAIGTARIASAVYDRCCRLAMDYQSAEDEADIVLAALTQPTPEGSAGHTPGGSAESEAGVVAEAVTGRPADPIPARRFLLAVVQLVRATRMHNEIRTGSSVRGAIDLVLLLGPLAGLRGVAVDEDSVTLDATLLALSGRIRLHESGSRTAEEILTELWSQHIQDVGAYDESDADPTSADPGSEEAQLTTGDNRAAESGSDRGKA